MVANEFKQNLIFMRRGWSISIYKKFLLLHLDEQN
jgi:hypothetical protein